MKKFMVPRVAHCKEGCQPRGWDPRLTPVFLSKFFYQNSSIFSFKSSTIWCGRTIELNQLSGR